MSISMKKTICALLLVICLSCAVALGLGSNSVAYAESDTAVPTSETLQSGLGMAINVVTAQKLNDFKINNMVFDSEKFQDIAVSRVNLSETTISSYSTTDINDLIMNFSFSTGIGTEAKAFLGCLSLGLSGSSNINFEEYSYKYFYIFESEVLRYRLAVNNYDQLDTFANCYSDKYLSDLAKLANNTMSYEEFFTDYGTHIVVSAYYGGVVNAYYSIASDKVVMNADLSLGIQEKIGAKFSNNTSADVLAYLNSKNSMSYTLNDIKTQFNVKAYGGGVFPGSSMSNFDSGYRDWATSFKDSDATVLGYGDGLTPLWELLPTEYQSLREEMEVAFNNYYDSAKLPILDEFKTANYEDFDGGSGAKDDPFLISSAKQLTKIDDASMAANYKLKNNIYLTQYQNWEPLGGFYKEKAFTGVLDGGYYGIHDLKRKADIEERNNRIHFGLFGYVGSGGEVRNLYFYGVDIKMTGPRVNNANTRVFVGVLAGSFHGKATNVRVMTGTCSYDANTNGMSFVGGIAGVGANATFTNCSNSIALTSGRWSGVAGGIVAHSNGSTFDNCRNTGSISTKCTGLGGYAISGGIVGEKSSTGVFETTIRNCSSTGKLSTSAYGIGWGGKRYLNDECAFTTTTQYE